MNKNQFAILVSLFAINLFCINSCSIDTKKVEVVNENPIVIENKKKGTLDWMIKVKYQDCNNEPGNHIYCRRKEVEAFCSETRYKAGDSLKIFISTDPASAVSLQIYRMGYYQGLGGTLVKDIGVINCKPQPLPPIDPKTNLAECKWDLAYSQIIPKDWTSGVYVGKLTTLKDSSQAYCIFIVKDNRKSDIIFQCSDLTWQAYNRWPYWNSMYDESAKPWVNTNGASISFDRPYALYTNELPTKFTPLSNGSGEFLIWEFPFAYWLEKEGYDISYISNLDTHTDTSAITRAKVFLSVAHDEYWTPQMYDNVKYARDKGVNLLFLSGNSLDGTVYLNPSTDGRANRITGRLPQREFDNEQDLMGASSYGVGYTDFVVSNGKSWVYEGTGLKTGDTIKNLVGWEYHGLPLSKNQQVEILAQNAIKPNVFTAKNAPDHACTIYTLPKGNFVFNAGTCWWPLAHAFPPGAQNPTENQNEKMTRTIDFSAPNEKVQQITRNLLKKAIRK